MKSIKYRLKKSDWQFLNKEHSNDGKNSHIGKKAVDIAILYFKSINKEVICKKEEDNIDLTISIGGQIEKYEVKGTASKEISFDRLKVSSQKCHDDLKGGLTLLRVCNVGQEEVTLHFMKYGEDFRMVKEKRWDVRKIKK